MANLLIFHTNVGMTRAIDQLTAEGMTIDDTALAGLSPYQTEHINRFGNYALDFTRIPAPLPSEDLAPGQVRPPAQGQIANLLSTPV